MQHRLAILDDYQDVAHGFADWAALEAEGVKVTTFREPFASRDALVSALADVSIVIAMRERTAFPREVFEKLPALQLLVTTGMANASINVAAATDHGVTVCGTPGSPTAAPELTWALLLAAARHLPAEENSLRAGTWQSTVGFELAGKTLGIVGLGKIGRRVAGYGRAFGMEVLAWSQNLTAAAAEEAGARLVSKEELFRASDVVTLHLRLSPRSENTVGEAELRLLGPEGILVNTARGPLVNQDALIRALSQGWIRGAALDVFDEEPLPAGHPLLAAPNTVLSPHLGYVTQESYREFYGGAFEDVTAWLAGSPIRTISG
ncbi:D-2-hydroxyacid dehydrogenase family protein [Arthrobacter nitrophenolicus]|uniref:D-2-hydroxyacid dehydrogenase family protein n=1 Tax=Arthrobacter nitrophenolicus TaxID=683150 RepID=A0A4R5Y2Z3_9MICC|nr:D-2-hydroxyacid dehydrogenase family protein [Arthrobacter nitrophenolicus]TDL37966.1 D-2-hydroxyacid dehydrogenase family protein [Arthrobacter nitrophenolicus]